MNKCKKHGIWMTPVAFDGGYTGEECEACRAERQSAVGMLFPKITLPPAASDHGAGKPLGAARKEENNEG